MAAVLITGGAGYIGSHVAWACVDRGLDVVIIDNLSTGSRRNVPSEAHFYQLDIQDTDRVAEIMRAHDTHSVMHFAGVIVVPESIVDPLKYYASNTAFTIGLLHAALSAGVQNFIFSSTAAVYAPAGLPVRETDATVPLSPYGASKLMSERILADASAAYGLRAIALRYFNVAGADPARRTGQSTPNATHLIKVAVQTALGRRPELTIFGDDYDTPDGTCVRDYIHVSDLADAHLLAMDHLKAGGGGGVFNVGYGDGASVREVVDAIEHVTGAALPVRISGRRPGDAPSLVADSSLLRTTLDWRPRFQNLQAIVRDALAWEDQGANTTIAN